MNHKYGSGLWEPRNKLPERTIAAYLNEWALLIFRLLGLAMIIWFLVCAYKGYSPAAPLDYLFGNTKTTAERSLEEHQRQLRRDDDR